MRYLCPKCKAEVEEDAIGEYRATRTNRRGRRVLVGILWTCPECGIGVDADLWFPCEWTPGAMP